MHLQYKKVDTHNNRSGASHVECPYYSELNNILKGDASIMPLSILWSLQLKHIAALQAATGSASLATTSCPTWPEYDPSTSEFVRTANGGFRQHPIVLRHCPHSYVAPC